MCVTFVLIPVFDAFRLVLTCFFFFHCVLYFLLLSARLFSEQVFSPTVSGAPDDRGVVREREVAAVHYSADKMDPHGRYDRIHFTTRYLFSFSQLL